MYCAKIIIYFPLFIVKIITRKKETPYTYFNQFKKLYYEYNKIVTWSD